MPSFLLEIIAHFFLSQATLFKKKKTKRKTKTMLDSQRMRVKSGLNNHLIQPPQFTDTNDKKKKMQMTGPKSPGQHESTAQPFQARRYLSCRRPCKSGLQLQNRISESVVLRTPIPHRASFQKKKKSVFSDSLSLRTNTFCVSSWSLEPSIRVKALKSPTVQPTIPNPFYIQRTLFI